MQYVEIYETQAGKEDTPNGAVQRTIARCTLVNGTVACEGDELLVDNLTRQGIPGKDPGKMLFPSDGLAFLEGLRYALSSGYMNASEIKEVAD